MSAPLFNWLGKKTRSTVELEIADIRSPAELREFSRSLQRNVYDVGVMWGAELGWLREEAGADAEWLVPLAVCLDLNAATKQRLPLSSQIIVRESSNLISQGSRKATLATLRGKSLAYYKEMPLVDRLFLQQVAGEDLTKYFREILVFETAGDAIEAVRTGKSDCAVINIITFSHTVANRQKGLRVLENSDELPPPVVVASRAHLDELRNGLWKEVQFALLTAHNNKRGEAGLRNWGTDRLVAPSDHFDALITASVKDFPLKALKGALQQADRRLK